MMRLKQITLPYLQSDMTAKDFADTVGLSNTSISQIIRRDLKNVYKKLYNDPYFDLKRVPRNIIDRNMWEKRVHEYIEIIILPEKIKRDNRKISDLTVEEFIALMSSFRVQKKKKR